MQIKLYKQLSQSPAIPLAVAGWHELIENHWCETNTCLVGWDSHAIVAFDDNKPVGVLTWNDESWNNSIQILLSYVVPNWRRQSIHTTLFENLKVEARKLGRNAIYANVSIGNTASRMAMRAQGRQEIGILTRYLL